MKNENKLGVLVAVACCQHCHHGWDAAQLSEMTRATDSPHPDAFECPCGELVYGSAEDMVVLPPDAFRAMYPRSDRARTRLVRFEPDRAHVAGVALALFLVALLPLSWAPLPALAAVGIAALGAIVGSMAWVKTYRPRLVR